MILERSASEVLAAVLIAKGVATDPLVEVPEDWAVHISYLPANDDRCISIYDTEPVKEGRIISSGEGIRRWGAQIVTRCGKDEYNLGWSRMLRIVEALEAVSVKMAVFEEGRYVIQEVEVDSGPMFFGRESDTERPKFSTNVLVLYTKV